MPKQPKHEIYCKFCNKKLTDVLVGCSCKNKQKWKNPYRDRNYSKTGGAPRKDAK